MDGMGSVRAIDVGYGNTKYVVLHNQGQEVMCASFPSLAPHASMGADIGSGVMQKRKTVQIDVNGVMYEVGKDARLAQDASFGRVLDENYPLSDPYMALVRGALYHMALPTIEMLVLGLPVNTFEKHKDALAKRVAGLHSLPNPLAGSPGEPDKIEINVNQVHVFPQPLGAFFDYAIRNKLFAEMKKQTNLIIDPGYYTLDWLLSVGITNVPSRTGAHSGGMSACLAAIAEAIGRDIGEQINDVTPIDEAIRTGTNPRYFGKEVDLKPYIPIAQSKVRQFVSVMSNKVGRGEDIDNIILGGGAASFFYEAIQEKFNNHKVIIAGDPIFANVRGFQLVGEEQIARQRVNRRAA